MLPLLESLEPLYPLLLPLPRELPLPLSLRSRYDGTKGLTMRPPLAIPVVSREGYDDGRTMVRQSVPRSKYQCAILQKKDCRAAPGPVEGKQPGRSRQRGLKPTLAFRLSVCEHRRDGIPLLRRRRGNTLREGNFVASAAHMFLSVCLRMLCGRRSLQRKRVPRPRLRERERGAAGDYLCAAHNNNNALSLTLQTRAQVSTA